MINSYRGIITVESEGAEDQIHVVLSGSRCRNRVPAVKAGSPFPRSSERILFVDDEPTIVNN